MHDFALSSSIFETRINQIFICHRAATCYMNVRMQDLFMNPAFRKAIYDLPLCQGSLNNPTQFVKGGARKMLLEIQRLFVMLQCCDRKAFST